MPDDVAVGRQFQAVRLARNLTQAEVACRAGVSRGSISRLERGEVSGITIATLRRVSGALVMLPIVTLGWRSPELDRLLDAAHAAMVERVCRQLSSHGWTCWPEHSFSEFGERGSIDILAWHPSTGTLLVVEVKTRLWNLQDMFMKIDRKRRLAPRLVVRLVDAKPLAIGTMLVLPETRAHRAAVDRHAATFAAALPDRQVTVRNWIREPAGDLRGIWFLKIARDTITRQRARPRRRRARPIPPRQRPVA